MSALVPLSGQQVAQYRRDGYVCPVPVMPAAESLALRRKLEAYEATRGGQLQAAQRSRAFLLFKWLDDLIRDPRVLDSMEQLIGPGHPVLEHDLLDQGRWLEERRVLAPGQHLLGLSSLMAPANNALEETACRHRYAALLSPDAAPQRGR
ncbi:MAG TPA: hypothetical protein VJ778_09590 [Burkholderiales bacterium]|nr:hypothetical protein [Burkholderiales bacterium]